MLSGYTQTSLTGGNTKRKGTFIAPCFFMAPPPQRYHTTLTSSARPRTHALGRHTIDIEAIVAVESK